MAYPVQVEVEDLSKTCRKLHPIAIGGCGALPCTGPTIEVARDGTVRFISAAGR